LEPTRRFLGHVLRAGHLLLFVVPFVASAQTPLPPIVASPGSAESGVALNPSVHWGDYDEAGGDLRDVQMDYEVQVACAEGTGSACVPGLLTGQCTDSDFTGPTLVYTTVNDSDCIGFPSTGCHGPSMYHAVYVGDPTDPNRGVFQNALAGKDRLSPDTTYCLRVRVRGYSGDDSADLGWSNWSGTVPFQTLALSGRRRYASPAGSGTTCSSSAPCSVTTAVNSGAAGDEVVLATGKGAYSITTTLKVAERMWIHTDTPRAEAVIGTTSPGLKSSWAGWGSDLPSGNVLARFQQDGIRVEDVRFRGNGMHPYDCGAPTSTAGAVACTSDLDCGGGACGGEDGTPAWILLANGTDLRWQTFQGGGHEAINFFAAGSGGSGNSRLHVYDWEIINTASNGEPAAPAAWTGWRTVEGFSVEGSDDSVFYNLTLEDETQPTVGGFSHLAVDGLKLLRGRNHSWRYDQNTSSTYLTVRRSQIMPGAEGMSSFSFNSSVRNVVWDSNTVASEINLGNNNGSATGTVGYFVAWNNIINRGSGYPFNISDTGGGQACTNGPCNVLDTASDRLLIDYNVFWSPQTSDVIAVWDCHVQNGNTSACDPATIYTRSEASTLFKNPGWGPHNSLADPAFVDAPTMTPDFDYTYNYTPRGAGVLDRGPAFMRVPSGGGPIKDVGAVEAGGSTRRALTAVLSGTGSGTVLSTPTGIVCPGTCSAAFDQNTQVALTGVPEPGSNFAGWSGDADCTDGVVTMSADVRCVGTFPLQSHTLAITGVSDSCTQTGSRIDDDQALVANRIVACVAGGGDCAGAYNYGLDVALTAATAAGCQVSAWSGACSGCPLGASPTCRLSIDADQTCAVTYTNTAVPSTFTLTLKRNKGLVKVTSKPAGLNCPGDCSEGAIPGGKTYVLTATTYPAGRAVHWGKDCTPCGTSSTCSVTVDRNLTCSFGL
jgi:hypothetical protein